MRIYIVYKKFSKKKKGKKNNDIKVQNAHAKEWNQGYSMGNIE